MRSSARRCAVTRTSASVLVFWAMAVARPERGQQCDDDRRG